MNREELLRSARNLYENPGTNEALKVVLEETYPELKDIEDERIRNLIYCIVRDRSDVGKLLEANGCPVEKALSWIEKQKEQKPAEWNDADMREARQNLISCCRDWERGDKTTLLPIVATRARYFLEHLVEPHQPAGWNKGDEGMLNCIIATLCEESHGGREANGKMVTWLENRLKSLPERFKPHWKPSDVQMEALAWYSGNSGVPPTGDKAIKSLYNDLKKLM